MSLRERILKEMVIDKEVLKKVKEVFNKLPIELQTYENFEKIQDLIKKAFSGVIEE